MNGQTSLPNWEGRLMGITYALGSDNDIVTVEVNNSLVEKKIHNVFGIIKGFVDPGTWQGTVGQTITYLHDVCNQHRYQCHTVLYDPPPSPPI